MPGGEQVEQEASMRLLAVTFAMIAMATLAGGSRAQIRGGDISTNRQVEQPQTNGLAPRAQAPVGHRQPTARDVPTENSLPLGSPGEREIDKKLQICRGC
jgi:hypothetical protein